VDSYSKGGCHMEDYGDWIWDESEYNFFMSLSDVGKLEYMYDYFNLDDDSIEGEFIYEEDNSPITSVDVVLTDTHLIITCDDDDVCNKTISMFKMDGFIMLYERTKGQSRFYKIVGQSDPFSVN